MNDLSDRKKAKRKKDKESVTKEFKLCCMYIQAYSLNKCVK